MCRTKTEPGLVIDQKHIGRILHSSGTVTQQWKALDSRLVWRRKSVAWTQAEKNIIFFICVQVLK